MKWRLLFYTLTLSSISQVSAQHIISGESETGQLDIKANTESTTVQLVWISPDPIIDNGKIYDTDLVTIELKLSKKIDQIENNDFTVFINGLPQKDVRSGEVSLKALRFKAQIKVHEGYNDIYVQIGNIKSTILSIRHSSRKPNLHLLAIAPGYNDNSNINTLKYTDDDAKDIVKTFSNQEAKGIYEKINITQVIGENATAANIRKELELLKHGNINSRDILLVFISSHGFIYNNGRQKEEFRIMGEDYDKRVQKTTSVSSIFVMEELASVPCRKKLLFIDACYSGKIGSKGSKETEAILNTIEALTNEQEGFVTFTSSRGNQESHEDEKWENGAFTFEIVKGLEGKADINKNHIITLEELENYVGKSVEELVKSDKGEIQQPKMFYRGLDKDMPIYVW